MFFLKQIYIPEHTPIEVPFHLFVQHEIVNQMNFQKKKTTISGVRGKKTTNTLINAKEESDKLKEQCAQQ